MVSTSILLGVLLAEAGLVAAGVLTLAGHAGWAAHRRRRQAPRLQHARQLLRVALDNDQPVSAAATELAAQPLRSTLLAILELSASISGQGQARLAKIATAAGLVEEAQRSCRSRRWWRRLRGVRVLARLGPAALPPHLLDDPHPAVRSAAAAAAARNPTSTVVTRLLHMLDDPDPLCRFTAKTALLDAGLPVTVPLARYLSDPQARRPGAALEVAATQAGAPLLPAALTRCADPVPEVRQRAARVLAAAGGMSAVQALTGLLQDPADQVRAAAATGLGQLSHWPAAPHLATRLGDPAWSVRRAAGLALRRLGPPGRLYLRRALTNEDPFVRDMARQVLDLPEGATETYSA